MIFNNQIRIKLKFYVNDDWNDYYDHTVSQTLSQRCLFVNKGNMRGKYKEI